MNPQMTIQVSGKGVAELPIPLSIRLLQLLIGLGASMLIVSAVFSLLGWSWIEFAARSGTLAAAAAVFALAFGIGVKIARSRAVRSLLSLRRARAGPPRWCFGGFRSHREAFYPCALAIALVATSLFLVYRAIAASSLPEKLTSFDVRTGFARPEGALPVFFWDYSTWIDPAWLKTREIYLPYEKGLPQKLLPKIHFRNATTHALELELHGRRPRSYRPDQVGELFNALGGEDTSLSLFSRKRALLPLLIQLEREAGVMNAGAGRPEEFFFLRFENGTRLIGVPWNELLAGSAKKYPGRFFFWGPDGSVFQVRCEEGAAWPAARTNSGAGPCTAAALLSRVEFPSDPRGSLTERRRWTGEQLRKLTDTLTQSRDPQARAERESALSLYLVSYLTIDPRDAEALFHLGKLARSREALESILKYARDVGLEPSKLLELQSLMQNLQ